MKLRKSLLIALALLAAAAVGCAKKAPASSAQEPSQSGAGAQKLSVAATLFPQYDFARAIAGDRAEVTMLLPNGLDSHSYDPTPADLVKISNSRLFLYTGEEMEPWSHSIVESLDPAKVTVVDVSSGVPLDQEEEADEDGGGDGHNGRGHVYDPHIWTDPVRAKKMAENIRDALIAADPEGEDLYRANAKAYLLELDALDEEFRSIVQSGKRNEIIFAGRFAFHYFCERYGLDHKAAFASCSGDAEPSVRMMAGLIQEINEKKIPVIFYEELTDPKVARSISGETGAKPLLLHSCHNVSRDEAGQGATYLSLMQQNADHLREALN